MHFDDVKVDDWVLVTCLKVKSFTPMGEELMTEANHIYGLPLRVKGVQLPFVFVEGMNGVSSVKLVLDTRQSLKLERCTREYYDAFKAAVAGGTTGRTGLKTPRVGGAERD